MAKDGEGSRKKELKSCDKMRVQKAKEEWFKELPSPLDKFYQLA